MKIRTGDVGRQCLVKYTDVGRLEGMIVGAEKGLNRMSVYIFNDSCVDRHVEANQIVELGEHIEPS